MQTSEVLNTAAELIEVRGWAQGAMAWGGDWDDETGIYTPSVTSNLCLEGALAAAMGKCANKGGTEGIWPDDLNACPAATAVRDYLQYGPGWLCYWNDDKERTAEQVIEALRAAALIAAAKENPDARENADERAAVSV